MAPSTDELASLDVTSLDGKLGRAVVQEPEGNIFAMWQPDPTAFFPPEQDF